MTVDRPILLPGSSGPPPDEEGPTPPPPRADEIPLDSPDLWTRGLLILCAIVGAGLAFLLHEMSVTFEEELPWTVWFIPFGAMIVIVGIRRALLPKSRRVIRLGDKGLELPKGRNSRRTLEVEYGDILTIVPLSSRGQPALVIDTAKRTQIYLAGDFPHPEMWRVLWAQLVDRIASQPDGYDQLRQMRQRAELSQHASSIKGRFTRQIFWVIAAIFAAQVFLAPPVSVLEFLYCGANSPVMVFGEGQWWRVVTANLLHGNGVHFAVNAFALFFLGTYCERLFGEVRTIVLILGTAVAGAMASLFGAEAMFAVGISTALFGLVGAYFALHLRFWNQIPPPYRQTKLWWTVILGLNGILSFAIPVIDAWGHLGGFVAGFILGWIMLRGQKNFRPRPESGRLMSLSAIALIALFASCAVTAVIYAVGNHPDHELLVAQDVQSRLAEEEDLALAQITLEWSAHQPRPDEVDTILLTIAHQVAQRTDDYYAHRWSMQAIANLTADKETIHLAQSPLESARVSEGRIEVYPAESLTEPRWVYLLTTPNGEAPTHILARCLPGDGRPDEGGPVAGHLPERFTLSIALITEADQCSTDDARVWQSVSRRTEE